MLHPDEGKCLGIKLLTNSLLLIFKKNLILFDPHFGIFGLLIQTCSIYGCLRVLVACGCSLLAGARCLRVLDACGCSLLAGEAILPAQKSNQKKLHVGLKQGHNSGSP